METENALTPIEGEQAPLVEVEPEETSATEDVQVVDEAPDPSSLQADIEALKAARVKAEEDARYWRQQKAEARAEYFRKDRDETPAPPLASAAKEPTEDTFDNYSDYVKALTDHRVKQARTEWERDSAIKREQETASQRQVELQTRLQDGYARYEDFGEVAFDPTAMHITPMIVDILQDCENPADVAYYLAKQRVEGVQISRMTPTKAAREIAKLDLKFTQNLQPDNRNKQKITKAPPPISPVGPAEKITKDPEKMNQAEYEAWRRSQGAKPY
uniref:Scaffolding protein n=1 Tax=viral metagenome TaxID=1070528 RepID=A0A6M3IPE3_9ZZZZ